MTEFSTFRRALRTATPAIALGTAVVTAALAACADSPTSPSAAAQATAAARATSQSPNYSSSTSTSTSTSTSEGTSTSSTTLTQVQGLLRTAPLTQTVVVTKYLSRGGGGITVPGTDLQLQVPNGAIPGDTGMTFTITAYAGNVVAYDFQPHGVKFLKPLTAVQQLGHTNWKSYNLPAGYYQSSSGSYFANESQVNFTTGDALVNEFMPSGVNVGGATMTWAVPHFSGYLVAWSRH